MPHLLRVSNNKRRWDKYPDVSWLAVNELQADALSDLKTDGGKLSVWQVEDDESNLQRLVAALAANRDKLDKVDYVLVDQKILEYISANAKIVLGDSPDEEANRWHLDLTELSVTKVVNLSRAISEANKVRRVLPKEVKAWVRTAIQSGWIDISNVNEKIRPEIKKLIESGT